MNIKRVAAAAAIATVLGISALTSGEAAVNAAPSDPPPGVPAVQPDPGAPAPGIPAMKCWPYGRSGGGNPRGGGGVPGFLPPCR
jgi:hypothetical protein